MASYRKLETGEWGLVPSPRLRFAAETRRQLQAALDGPQTLGSIMDAPFDTSAVTRFEVIDQTGRVLVAHGVSELMPSVQDDGRTLKIFCKTTPPVAASDRRSLIDTVDAVLRPHLGSVLATAVAVDVWQALHREDDAMTDRQTTPPTPEFKALFDGVVGAGHTCESVLRRLDARIAATLPGAGRDNLTAFRVQLVEQIDNARRCLVSGP